VYSFICLVLELLMTQDMLDILEEQFLTLKYINPLVLLEFDFLVCLVAMNCYNHKMKMTLMVALMMAVMMVDMLS